MEQWRDGGGYVWGDEACGVGNNDAELWFKGKIEGNNHKI